MEQPKFNMPWLYLDRNGTLRCEGCSKSYLPGLPVPEEIYAAIVNAFEKLHWSCGKPAEPYQEKPEEKEGVSGLEVKDVNIEGGLNITFGAKDRAKDVFALFGEVLGDMLDSNKARNYVSLTYRHPRKGDLELLVQIKTGRTPSEINSELRAALALALEHATHGPNCTPTQCYCALEPAVRARGSVELATLLSTACKNANLDLLKGLYLKATEEKALPVVLEFLTKEWDKREEVQ